MRRRRKTIQKNFAAGLPLPSNSPELQVGGIALACRLISRSLSPESPGAPTVADALLEIADSIWELAQVLKKKRRSK